MLLTYNIQRDVTYKKFHLCNPIVLEETDSNKAEFWYSGRDKAKEKPSRDKGQSESIPPWVDKFPHILGGKIAYFTEAVPVKYSNSPG